jgi:flagellar basal body-associated protein FliL
MAKPTSTKDAKPKAEEEAAKGAAKAEGGGGVFDLKFIILVVVVLLSTLLSTAGTGYLVTTMFIIPEIGKIAHASGEKPHGEEGAEKGEHGTADPASTEVAAHEVGMNLELDEFTVNLKEDSNLEGSQFLRAKVALSVKVPEAENCYATGGEHKATGGVAPGMPNSQTVAQQVNQGVLMGAAASVEPVLLANGGGEGGPSCEDVFKKNMAKHVPTMRDIINASLMKRTATLLATMEGQEALKDEIKAQLSTVMAPDYAVVRVNFQDFIIQK